MERVLLRPGKPTTFRLCAGNDGGDAEGRVTLQLPAERPAFVVIEKLESSRTRGDFYYPLAERDQQGRPVQPDPNGRPVFDFIPEGRVVVHGRILWTDPADRRSQGPVPLRVFVNGLQQLLVETGAARPGQGESTFSATTFMTRPTNNLIRVELLDPGMADSRRSACVVRQCRNYIRGCRLHLLAIGIQDSPRGETLRNLALKAIGAQRNPTLGNRWQALPAFDEVEVYELPDGSVTQGQVQERLIRIKAVIQATAKADRDAALSDVVLIYYRGEIAMRDGLHLLTDDSKPGDTHLEWTAVACEWIVDLFKDVRGAQVVMLDVKQSDADAPETDSVAATRSFRGTRFGVFQAIWLGREQSPAVANRLLTLLGKSWPDVNSLGALARHVETMSQRMAPRMRFFPYLPEDLDQLEFGGKP